MVMNIVSELTAGVLDLPAQYFGGGSVAKGYSAFVIEPVNALARRIEDQLMLDLELRQLIRFQVEFS